MSLTRADVEFLYDLLGRVPIPHQDQDRVLEVSSRMKKFILMANRKVTQ